MDKIKVKAMEFTWVHQRRNLLGQWTTADTHMLHGLHVWNQWEKWWNIGVLTIRDYMDNRDLTLTHNAELRTH